MRLLGKLVTMAAVVMVGVTSVQGAQVVCGDPNLGLRVTTVDPAATCTYAGLQNLGNPALVSLLDGLIGGGGETVLLNRDTTNNNGGLLNITGVGTQAGSWTIDPSVWEYDRVFLWFHFGDAQDDPSTTSDTDPDVFIVELARADETGTWAFGGKDGAKVKLTGLSNIGLLGSGTDDGEEPPSEIPEPSSLALLGLALLGAATMRRRRS